MTWQREALRDLEALGSYTFYAVTAARSLIGFHWQFLVQAIGAVVLGLVLWQTVKAVSGIKASAHASNAVMLLILVNSFYQSIPFLVFTLLLLPVICGAHFALRKHRTRELVIGLLIGLVSGGAAWWLVPQLI